MEEALTALKENSISQAIKKFERQKIENEGAKVLLSKINEFYQSQREMACNWIVGKEQISSECKFRAYNILGCTLDQEKEKLTNFTFALKIGINNHFDISDTLINFQKMCLRFQKYELIIKYAKYSNSFEGRHKVVALYNQAKGHLGLNQITQCKEYSQFAYQECRKLYGPKDSMTLRLEEYLNLLEQNLDLCQNYRAPNDLNQSRLSLQNSQLGTNSNFVKTFTQFDIPNILNEVKREDPNTQELRAEFCYQNKKTNTIENQIFCRDLIQEFFGFADISIIIRNIKPNSTCSALFQDYQNVLQEILDEGEIQNNKISQINNISDETTKNNAFTYQLTPQNENNISQLDKMIYLQRAQIQGFLIQSVQKDINLKLDEKLFQYQVKGSKSKQDEINDFFQNLKNTLDNIVILTYQCQSEVEAVRILSILKQKIIYKNISKQLNVEDLDIMLSYEINLSDFSIYPTLLIQAQKLKSNTNSIIVICKLKNPFNLQQLQNQFQGLVQKSQYLQLIKDQFDIELAFNPDVNAIDQKIKQLEQNEEQFEISVSQPELNVGNKKMFVVNSVIQFWMDTKTQSMDEVQQIFTRIKNLIYQIYFPTLNITVNDEKQMKLWQNFLYQFHPNNPKESYIINTQLLIEIQGESTKIEGKYKSITKDLTEFQFKRFSFDVQEAIAKALAEEQNFENQFKSSLERISKKQGQCLIQIVGISSNKILVDVYVNDKTKLNNIQNDLQKDFFDKLCIHVEKNLDIDDLYAYLGMEKQQFKAEYEVEVHKCNKEYIFISLNLLLDEVKQLIEFTKQDLKENIKTKCIECLNTLVFVELRKKYVHESTYGNEEIKINFAQNNKIIIKVQKQELLKTTSETIVSNMKILENQLISKVCTFQEKQMKFFKKNFESQYKDVENEKSVAIKFQTNQFSIISKVLFQDKKLYLIQANIISLECDAIVNFHCSNKYNLGVSSLTQEILDFGGTLYQQYFLELLTNNIPSLNLIEITISELGSFRNIRYIINLIIPSQSILGNNNPQTIQQIFDRLFDHIQNKYQISRLAIPIFNICGNTYAQNIQTYLNAIIQRLFNNEHPVNQIYLAEIDQSRIKIVDSVLSDISKISPNSHPKYQWQWRDKINFANYNEDINKQIDDAYEIFEKSQQEIIIDLKFQIESKPSTHSVDLKNLKIKELSSNFEQKIIFQRQKNKISYFINDEELEQELTQYFINMYNKKCYLFDIFWKNLQIVFNNQGMYQLNTKTNYQRIIQKIPYQQGRMESKITYELNINQIQECQNQIVIQSFDSDLNDMILKEIKEKLSQSLTTQRLVLPQLSNNELKNFTGYIESLAQSIQGRMMSGQTINVQIFKNKEKKLFQQLELVKTYAKEYPKNWKAQTENYIKVLLDQNSQEYNKIKNLFQKTDKGSIKAIFRIQNKALWDNYILERKKLFDIYEKQKQLLLPQERERYLWHGVSSQHPQVIYLSLAEAFDVSYSRVGLWGDGIYFAENASYSRNYSYKIQTQDDPKYAGNLVFLCCLVTTGKAEDRQQNTNIRKPSDGFDCVTGFTNGSNIFVIYQMHVRRAYPAYEVIYS
ncbi:unnamed protein product [Paramecium octaurelia]|uniref:Poly [ADP-ribose] polymerase n=1 Tax=Paramecium octaurelia TaxID=43137 RepID=A0A8S1UTH7_PAROT|nr:unnamed protein product [Paramecium octaurelia]